MPSGELSLHWWNSVCIIDDFKADCYLTSIDSIELLCMAFFLSVVNRKIRVS